MPKKFQGDYYKTKNLTLDERTSQRSNQRGIWLTAGRGFASRREALAAAREMGGTKVRTIKYDAF